MMKILLCCAALLAAVPAESANWGLDAGGHFWEMDSGEMEKYADALKASGNNYSYTLETGAASLFPSLFVEGTGALRLGAAFGYGLMPEASIVSEFSSGGNDYVRDLRVRTNHMALDVYLKLASKDGRGGIFAGGGADLIRAEAMMTTDMNGASHTEKTFVQRKLVPHLRAGAELAPLSWLSLYAGAKYVVGGALDDLKSGSGKLIMTQSGSGEAFAETNAALTAGQRPLEIDYSGLRLMAGVRIYFK